jgi:hypothetical protein
MNNPNKNFFEGCSYSSGTKYTNVASPISKNPVFNNKIELYKLYIIIYIVLGVSCIY